VQWKFFAYFKTIWFILRPLKIVYGHLVYLVVIWYIFPRFGILYQEKSGNPDLNPRLKRVQVFVAETEKFGNVATKINFSTLLKQTRFFAQNPFQAYLRRRRKK
jgi:hypothetical protein